MSDNNLYRWVKADINNLPTKEVYIRYGDDEKEHGSASLILELIENGWLNVEVLVKVEADQNKLWKEVLDENFSIHDSYYKEQIKKLKSKYTLIPNTSK